MGFFSIGSWGGEIQMMRRYDGMTWPEQMDWSVCIGYAIAVLPHPSYLGFLVKHF